MVLTSSEIIKDEEAAVLEAVPPVAKAKVTEVKDATAEGDNRIPVTILSGFLGSGKTTLLKYLLESPDHGLKVAVIVNDMAEINIDASLVTAKGLDPEQAVVQTKREIVSLQNGCICCTLRGDLIREIVRIRELEDAFDYVLIESTGIAEPMNVAQAFVFDAATAQLARDENDMLWKQAKLDTCVTVIDAHSFLLHMETLQQFADAFADGLDTSTEEGKKEGEKSIATLLMDQVEFADVILLNKSDLVESEVQLVKTREVIKTLNPSAKLMETKYCQIDLKEILNTGLFDMAKARASPGWMQEIRKIEDDQESLDPHLAAGEAEEYGVGSFVYRARHPFHPNRIAKWIDSILHFANEWADLPKQLRSDMQVDPKYKTMLENYGNILRAKGFCWLADHDTFMMGFAQSGRIGTLHGIMPWYVIIPKDQWGVEEGSNDYKVIESKFAEPHGDRRQEIVFIGTDLKQEKIKKDLDACLLTKKELKHYKFYSDKSSLGG